MITGKIYLTENERSRNYLIEAALYIMVMLFKRLLNELLIHCIVH